MEMKTMTSSDAAQTANAAVDSDLDALNSQAPVAPGATNTESAAPNTQESLWVPYNSELDVGLAEAERLVYSVNRRNGWFEEDRTFGEDIALLHSEVSEALEAYRNWGIEDATSRVGRIEAGTGRHLLNKPEGVGSELADILVRLLDTAGRYGIDLYYEFERKMKFNAQRGYRHGGKRL